MAGATPPRKRLVIEEFDRLIDDKGWSSDTEIAAALGMSQPQVSRVRREKNRPGQRFIDGCVKVWGERITYRVLLADDEAGDDADETAAA